MDLYSQNNPYFQLPFFALMRKKDPKIIWKSKGPQIVKAILKKKGGSLTLPNLITYNKGTKIRTVWYYNRDKHTDEKNRIENQEICS